MLEGVQSVFNTVYKAVPLEGRENKHEFRLSKSAPNRVDNHIQEIDTGTAVAAFRSWEGAGAVVWVNTMRALTTAACMHSMYTMVTYTARRISLKTMQICDLNRGDGPERSPTFPRGSCPVIT
jgi:hypothetical protein